MNIVWFSWKDIKHPRAGGAELISWRLMTKLANDGHNVSLITSQYAGASEYEVLEKVEIFRSGGRYSVYPKARSVFKQKLKNKPDLVIDEMNTIPFGAAFYSHCPSILLTYQLARKVWFHQMPQPVSTLGYLIEPLYLRIMAAKYPLVLTESESTRRDLSNFGFKLNSVKVFRVGIDLAPLYSLPPKTNLKQILILGSIRPMKRTLEAIKSFEIARDKMPDLTLTVAGDDSGPYADQVKQYVANSKHSSSINLTGRVDETKRLNLMLSASVILVASVKEGWGLIVTEANSQGTPAIVFDCDGLRDSVKDQQTGLLVPPGDVMAMGKAINDLLSNQTAYQALRQKAWEDSKQYNFSNCYADFRKYTGV